MVTPDSQPGSARRAKRAILCTSAVALIACSPALDWREVKPAGTRLVAQMPCRPSEHARQVMLSGQARSLILLSCSAAESTWGLSWVEGVQPLELGDTLAAMRQAALANIGAKGSSVTEFSVPGALNHPQGGRTRSEGRRPDGSIVIQDMVLFARGLTAFQATVLTDDKKTGPADEFFGALRFTP